MDQAFTWGAGGAQMTPERIAAQRKVADAMAARGMDTSPIRSPWQGAANMAQALVGALKNYQADKSEQANQTADQQMIAQLLGGAPLNIQPPAASAPATSAPTAPQYAQGGSTIPLVQSGDTAPPNPGLSNAISAVAAARAPTTLVGDNPTYAPRGIRNNNPGNIEDGPFARSIPGYAGTDGRFAKFDSPQGGATAMDSLLASYGGRGINTVGGVINRWAPATDNNPTSAYAATVAKQLGVDPNAPIDLTDPAIRSKLAGAIGQFENGRPTQQVASLDPNAGVPAAPAAVPGAPVPAGVAQVAQALPNGGLAGVNPIALRMLTSPNTSDGAKKIAGLILQQQMGDKLTYQTTPDGDILALDPHGRMPPKVVYQGTAKPIVLPEGSTALDPRTHAVIGAGGDKDPQSVKEWQFYKKNLPPGAEAMDYATFSTAKARAGATNITNSVDMNSGQTYDKLLAEGLGKSHSALSNGVEDAQARARDLAAMQGAIDTIQKNGGTTGGLGQAQIQDLKKTLNAGANAVGITTPFNENDISDKEFLQKFNRQIAGAQAKGAVGSRVTNFEMQNYLKANPGLDMSITGNQRLVGIQSQIERRNIEVGNQIRQATAQAISKGQKIDPVTVQKLITDYDEAHHIKDPVNGQDLTQSYTLPEFQTGGSNPAMAVGHEQNINGIKIKRIN